MDLSSSTTSTTEVRSSSSPFVASPPFDYKRGWNLTALDLGVDTSTPAGEMMASVFATFAQFERRLIGQRTKDALAVKRAQGVVLGRPRRMSEDTVERIRELRRLGMSVSDIAHELNAGGVPTATGRGGWHPPGVARALPGSVRDERELLGGGCLGRVLHRRPSCP